MAQDCDQPDYNKLVQALCTEANVNLITVPASKTLGEWCGLCKLDAEGLARKVVGCSFVVIKARSCRAHLRTCAALARGLCRALPRCRVLRCAAAFQRQSADPATRCHANRTTGRSPRRWALFRST